MQLGISIKLTALLSLFGLLLTGLASYYLFSSSQQILIDAAKRDLQTANQVLGRNLQLSLQGFANDARVLAEQSQPRDVLEQRPDRELEEKELIGLFQALLAVHPEYQRIRLIMAREHGLERISVDHQGPADASSLVEKGHFPYVFETLRLARGEQYFSDIAQHGSGSAEAMTLHIGNPVWNEAPEALGLILLSIDVQALFMRLESELPDYYQVFLANSQGDLLLYPDGKKRQDSPHGPQYRLHEELPLTRSLVEGEAQNLLTRLPATRKQPERIAAFTRVRIDERSPNSVLLLGIAIPEEHILRESQRLGQRSVQIVIALSVLTLLLALLLARALTRPLNQIGQAIARFARNRSLHPLPTGRQDELGSLARNLRDMQEEILRQISELNENRIELERLAHHDPLTGLPNRRLFFDRLEHAIANAKRSGKRVGLLFVDLDHFKEINDELGHAIGDEVLCSIARLLSSITRGGDTVARLGGDEFIILFDQIEDGKILSGIAQKLLGHLQNRLLLGGHQVLVQASLGISLYPEHGDTAESLVQNADKAMYSSKRDGRNRVSLAHHEP